MRWFVALVLAVLSAACARLPVLAPIDSVAALPGPAHVPYFQLEGRLSVRAQEQSFSGALAWLRRPDAESMLLSTPLGQGVAEIQRVEGGMRLVDAEGRSRVAADGETLLEDAVGLRLPLNGLVYWLSARPRPEAPFTASLDETGRVAVMQQDGWRIDYGRYREAAGRWLPGKIFARRGEALEFRLVIDSWEPR